MVLFILRVLLLLVGLLLVGIQFLYRVVKTKREEIAKARIRLAIVWMILLLFFIVKIKFFR